jgi:HK97 family phage major capsid protein
MEAAVRRLLSLELFDIRETQFYTGTGTAPQVNGLYTRGTTFDYAAWTGITTTQANIFDLCMLLKSEISRQYGAKFIPDTVLMNPTDWLAAQWVKTTEGVYVRNPFASPDGMNIAGMKVITSPKVTANTLMVGDSRYATLYLGDNIEIELGYDTGDFRDDLVTMKARHRFATKISPVDALGWYKVASVTAACTAITTATS